jgi:ACS family D-galactonate transporter-like MFS transporter
VLAHWFPQQERARANSIYAIGQTAGTGFLIVPLLWLANNYGWRALFIMTGIVGVIFGFIWYLAYREPQDSKLANKAELDYIVAGGGLKSNAAAKVTFRWKYVAQLLGFRQILCASIAQFCGNTVLVFFLIDFANYLATQRHMAYLHSPLFVALPYIAAATGGVAGGLIADTILKKGGSTNLARKLPVVGGLLLGSCIALANFVPLGQDGLVVAIMCVAFFGQGATNLGWTVISDLAPRQLIGLTGGVFNMITNLAGILTPTIIGIILQVTGSYFYSLMYVGALPLIGAFLYVFVMGDIRRLEIAE